MTATQLEKLDPGLTVPGAGTERRAARMPHMPQLDGFRGIGLIGMLLYHHGATFIPGGVLTVSMFFSLSGFLITMLLLMERGSTEATDLGRFYARRARRLLPAAIGLLFVLALLRPWLGSGAGRDFPGDVASALGYVANWRFVLTNRSYANLFGFGSPVQHFWSLSVEEQFYLVFPLLFIGAMKLARGNHLRFAGLIAALSGVSFVIGAWLVNPEDASRVYYGTETRAGEFLVGAVLAALLSSPEVRQRLLVVRTAPWFRVLGMVAFAVLMVVWIRIGFHTPWLFPWGVVINVVLSAVVITCSFGGGPLYAILSWGPFTWLGRMAYATYLIHWPVFLVLNPQRLDLPGWLLFAIRVTVALTLAWLSSRFLEEPVRSARLLRSPRVFAMSIGAGMLITALLAFAIPAPAASDPFDARDMAAARRRVLSQQAQPDVAGSQGRVLIIGDSQAWTVSGGLVPWGKANGVQVEVMQQVGCGLTGDTPIRYLGVDRETKPECVTWMRDLPTAMERFRPDVVLVVGGFADLSDRRIGGEADGAWSHIGQPRYDTWLRDRMERIVAMAGTSGASVLWATLPHYRAPYQPGHTGTPPFVENEPARVDRLNEIIADLDAQDPNVSVVDFAAYSRAQPGGEFDREYRPDGVHLVQESTDAAAPFFGEAILGVLAARGSGGAGATTTTAAPGGPPVTSPGPPVTSTGPPVTSTGPPGTSAPSGR